MEKTTAMSRTAYFPSNQGKSQAIYRVKSKLKIANEELPFSNV